MKNIYLFSLSLFLITISSFLISGNASANVTCGPLGGVYGNTTWSCYDGMTCGSTIGSCLGTPTCSPINGNYGGWGECTVECGGGIQTRLCNNPPPSCGGSCPTPIPSRSCNTQACPISEVSGGATVCPPGQFCNPLRYGSFEELVNAIIRFLNYIGIPLAAIMFVIAGVLFVTSAGDPTRVQTAKNFMLYTIIGLSILLVSSGIIKVLQSLLGKSS
jgi:hypothetical protein